MANSLYASFPEKSLAEKAAGALLDHGVRSEDISLVWKGSDDNTAVTHTIGRASSAYAATPTEPVVIEDREVVAGSGGYTREVRSDVTATSGAYQVDPTVVENREHYDTAKEARDTDLSAKQGISTTTGADAGVGAMAGTAIGAGVGLAAALAALFIPGVGIVVGGGALAVALGGVAATAGAGAAAGAVTGYLKDMGVDEQVATRYDTAIQGGGAMIQIATPSGGLTEEEIRSVLYKYGANDVQAFALQSSSSYVS